MLTSGGPKPKSLVCRVPNPIAMVDESLISDPYVPPVLWTIALSHTLATLCKHQVGLCESIRQDETF